MNHTERRVIAVAAFVSACLCFAPGEVVSGSFLALTSLALYLWDRRLLRREEALLPAPAQAPPATPTAE